MLDDLDLYLFQGLLKKPAQIIFQRSHGYPQKLNPYHNRNHHRIVRNNTLIEYRLSVLRDKAQVSWLNQRFLEVYLDCFDLEYQVGRKMLHSHPFHEHLKETVDANYEII